MIACRLQLVALVAHAAKAEPGVRGERHAVPDRSCGHDRYGHQRRPGRS
jgi:hypothetical protein